MLLASLSLSETYTGAIHPRAMTGYHDPGTEKREKKHHDKVTVLMDVQPCGNVAMVIPVQFQPIVIHQHVTN